MAMSTNSIRCRFVCECDCQHSLIAKCLQELRYRRVLAAIRFTFILASLTHQSVFTWSAEAFCVNWAFNWAKSIQPDWLISVSWRAYDFSKEIIDSLKWNQKHTNANYSEMEMMKVSWPFNLVYNWHSLCNAMIFNTFWMEIEIFGNEIDKFHQTHQTLCC